MYISIFIYVHTVSDHHKMSCFLMFSVVIKVEHWPKMGEETVLN